MDDNIFNPYKYGSVHREDVTELNLSAEELRHYSKLAQDKLVFNEGFCGTKNQLERIDQGELNRMYCAIDWLLENGGC